MIHKAMDGAVYFRVTVNVITKYLRILRRLLTLKPHIRLPQNSETIFISDSVTYNSKVYDVGFDERRQMLTKQGEKTKRTKNAGKFVFHLLPSFSPFYFPIFS